MSDIQEQLSERMEQVQWHGEYFSAICPFPHHGHKETHPSMLVYPDGYVCKGCHKSGKLPYLLSRLSKTPYLADQIRITKPNILPRWIKWGYKYGDIQEIAASGHKSLLKYPQHQYFFKARKIDQFIDPGFFGFIDGWMLFPVFDPEKKIVDIVVRAGKGKGDTRYVLRPCKDRESPHIYVPNWRRVLDAEEVYVVYGIIDAWAFEELGLPVITGTTGKSLSPQQLKPLDKTLIIVPDRDEDDAAFHLANKLGWSARVHRVKYPPESKDPDEIRIQFGADKLRAVLGL